MARPRSLAFRVFCALSAALAVLPAMELLLRLLLLPGCGAGEKHRRAGLYADPYSEDAYWALKRRWNPAPTASPRLDRELGWTGDFDPGTWKHHERHLLKGRRPVLLYGDSFSSCVEGVICFQEILEDEPGFSREFRLLNYGTGGYGIGQTLLLMERTLPLFPDAVVVAGLMTLDIDRAVLSLRDAPKPRLRLEGGALVRGQASAPEEEGALPHGIRSFLYRKLLFSRFIPSRVRAALRDEAVPRVLQGAQVPNG